MSTLTLHYPLFDGEKVIENAAVTVENGVITAVTESTCVHPDKLLMPGLIDAHTHMTDRTQVDALLKNGVVATCDVSAPRELVANPGRLLLHSSAGMTMGTSDGKGFVEAALKNGAQYLKVLLFEPNRMPADVLKSICTTAHAHRRKVAVHATNVAAAQMAVTCGADLLIHVPMKEALPERLAAEIAERGIAVAPTLVMMEAFAHSGRNGYTPEQYANAEQAVRTLHRCGVTILAATDANVGSFAPAVPYGSSMHREAELLCRAGLTPVEVLASATSRVSRVFELDGLGAVAVGKRASLVLTKGRPDKQISALRNEKQIWADGELIP